MKYVRISMKKEIMEAIENFIDENPQLGYRSLAQFLEDAARRRADELNIFKTRKITSLKIDETLNFEDYMHTLIHSSIKATIHASEYCSWFMDRNGIIIDVNEKCEELCGKTREELIGKNFHELMNYRDPTQISALLTNFSDILAGKEVEIRMGDGKLIIMKAQAVTLNSRVLGLIATAIPI